MIITGKKFSKPELSRVINGDVDLSKQDDATEKFRLDHLLVKKYPEYNRSSLQTFIKKGFVTVNNQLAKKPNEKYEATAIINLNVPKASQNLPKIPVLYEDSNVIVLDKPAGLLSMAKGEYCPEPTLEDYGLLVHRLDRDTSGVVILAKNPATQTMLRKQFQDRKTHKTYLAIVEGHPKLNEAIIDLPIARNLKHPTTFLVDQNGKPSQTYYKVLQTNGELSLLELKPKTGRTHQLRVHLRHLGTPILGDPVYGSEGIIAKKKVDKGTGSVSVSNENAKDHTGPHQRLMLHAKSLEITIPNPTNPQGDNIRRTFTAPTPPEFTEVLKKWPILPL